MLCVGVSMREGILVREVAEPTLLKEAGGFALPPWAGGRGLAGKTMQQIDAESSCIACAFVYNGNH